jgi:hypothetical protein
MLTKSNTPTSATLRWRRPGFDVAMASGWCCSRCLKPLRPSAVRCDDGAVFVICESCHVDLLRVDLHPTG